MALPIGVLISGSGSNLQSLIDKIDEGVLDAEIRLVISNKSEAYGLERAAKAGIPTIVLKHGDYSSREDFDSEMVRSLKDAGVEAVVMAGFMRIITSVLLNAFPCKVINIHPALLPAFPGVDAQTQAHEYGVKIAGCSVHFVDEEMDSGPIILQAAVPVDGADSRDMLQKKILEMEHRIYPQAVQWLAEGRIHVDGRSAVVAARTDSVKDSSVVNGFDNGFLVSPPLEENF